MGAISGAHLNPAVSMAFAARGDFPWRRVPGYIIAQLVGATLACLLLWALFGKVGLLGATEPGSGISDWQALLMECVLTAGLVSTIPGTASRAQNLGRARRSGWVPTSSSPGSGPAPSVGPRSKGVSASLLSPSGMERVPGLKGDQQHHQEHVDAQRPQQNNCSPTQRVSSKALFRG